MRLIVMLDALLWLAGFIGGYAFCRLTRRPQVLIVSVPRPALRDNHPE